MIKKNILVIGAGTWGTAIANVLADNNNNNIYLSSIEPDTIEEINNKNSSQKYLPNIKLSKNLKAIANYDDFITKCDIVFIVVPSFIANQVFNDLSQKNNIPDNCSFVICSKGLDPNSLKILTNCFAESNKDKKYAVLSGPNFAIEVAQKMPTITNICSSDQKVSQDIIKALNNNYFKAIHDSQPVTAEICGIVKNILAIGCGIIDGLDLGVNSKAALITYGTQEIKILCKFFNCDGFIATPAGFGDIFLTCSSSKSRNNSLGNRLALGAKYHDIVKQTNATYEGAISASSIAKLCQKHSINLPLCLEINDIIYGSYSSCKIREKIVKILIN